MAQLDETMSLLFDVHGYDNHNTLHAEFIWYKKNVFVFFMTPSHS